MKSILKESVSIDEFIKQHTEICPLCEDERLNYEMGKKVCLFCEQKLKEIGYDRAD